MISLKDALTLGTTTLDTSSTSARIDAELLLCHVLQVNRTYLYTHSEIQLNEPTLTAYHALIHARQHGTPIAYLTGSREFWSLPLQVSPATLIPRPETELLVEKTLDRVDKDYPARILDLGTGSGAIALALAHTCPKWHITACDKSAAAIEIAQHNAKQLQVTNVEFVCSDWFSAIRESTFDAIVSNPPYIAARDPHVTMGDLRFEPMDALVSGEDGLNSLRYIIKYSYNRLVAHGVLLLEHGYNQRQAVATLLKDSGYQQIQCWQDWQGHDRVSYGRR